ncbi:MAG: hypothetical protein AAB381_02910 [Patescibacteria group bacterium]
MNIRPHVSIPCTLILGSVLLLWVLSPRRSTEQRPLSIEVASSSERPHEMPTPEFVARPAMQHPLLVRSDHPRPEAHIPSAEEILGSFTTLPASLRDPKIVKAIQEHRVSSSRILSAMPKAPLSYDPPELSEDPTDEEIAARDRYDLEFRSKRLATADDERTSLAQVQIAATEALNGLETTLGAAYPDYVQWTMAESIAATLSWHLESEQGTRSAAENIVKMVSQGHSVDDIFDRIEILKPLRGTEVVTFVSTRVRP